jgi:plastocyanin
MLRKISLILLAFAVLVVGANAQSISGTILIKKRLTRRSVTPSVSVYQRGVAVKLGTDDQDDPLALERSRVVIYLEGPDSSPSSPVSHPVVRIEQHDRRFSPDIVAVPVGATVSFPNMDPIFHNIFSLSKPKSFDLGSYDKGETRNVYFPKAGIVEIYCHLHPNMAATVVVTPNRWYAQSDRSGEYRIPDVPPGRYTIVAWHRSAGFFRKSIVVEAGQDSTADFFIPIDDDPKPERAAKDSLASNAVGR